MHDVTRINSNLGAMYDVTLISSNLGAMHDVAVGQNHFEGYATMLDQYVFVVRSLYAYPANQASWKRDEVG